MGKNRARKSGVANSTPQMELDRTHAAQTRTLSVTRQALKWNPQGKRNRGRPRATCGVDPQSKKTLRRNKQLDYKKKLKLIYDYY